MFAFCSCGIGTNADDGLATSDGLADAEDIEAVAEKADDALEKAEEAERAIEGIEAELLALVLEVEGGGGDEMASHDEGGSEEAHVGPVHWSYSGPEGPDSWAILSPDFAVCETGVKQSPIDIVASDALTVGLDDLSLNWTETTVEVVDNGHTIQANVSPGSTTIFDGRSYDLVQFHFHRPSEHTVGGEPFPMELHFVHVDAGGSLAVLGVMLATGDENSAFGDVVAAQSAVGGDALLNGFDLSALLPADLGRFRYSGSLTTPPCSEGVNRNVLADPITVSQGQIDGFLYDGNARNVLPLNGRSVLVDAS